MQLRPYQQDFFQRVRERYDAHDDDKMGTSGLQAHPNAMEVASVTSPSEEYRLIPLTQGQFAKVSVEDFDWLSRFSWQAHWKADAQRFYGRRTYRKDGKLRAVAMHRFIMGLENGNPRQVDHVNRDTLDNRRSNLRFATQSQNHFNQAMRRDSTTGYKCITLDKSRGLYTAKVMREGKLYFLGYRKTAKEAYEELYLPAVGGLHGEFARTK